MKQILIILGLFASVTTFAQSPRIKLNQITKDSVTGSVLISSPTDSGMVYSRDLFISYGADTVLILGGDTLAATSSIISSVLSDGVTITGNGTLGSELTADTSVLATLKALSDSLALVISSVTADNVTITGDGTVGSPLEVDTLTYIATKQDLDSKQDQLNGTGFVKATGTTISYDNSTYLTSEVDGSVTNEIQDISTTGAAGNISISSGSTLNLNVDDADASASNELQTLSYNSSTNEITLSDGGGTEDLSNLDLVDSTRINATGDTAYYYQNGVLIGTGPIAGGGGGTSYNNISETADTVYISDYLDVDTATLYVDATNNRVGIGTSNPITDFQVNLINNNNIPNDFLVQKNTIRNGFKFGGIHNNLMGYMLNADSTYISFLIDVFGTKNSLDDVGVGGDYQSFSVSNKDVSGGGNLYYKKGAFGIYNSYSDGGYGYYNFGAPGFPTIRLGIGIANPANTIEAYNGAKLTAAGVWTDASDIRIKTNIRDLEYGLTELKQLRPVSYTHKTELVNQIGFIAQEINSVIPEVVSEQGKYFGISYGHLTALTVKAIQEQQAIIESQATEIEQLKSQIQLILSEIEQIKNN